MLASQQLQQTAKISSTFIWIQFFFPKAGSKWKKSKSLSISESTVHWQKNASLMKSWIISKRQPRINKIKIRALEFTLFKRFVKKWTPKIWDQKWLIWVFLG